VQALRKSGDSAVVETGVDTIRMIPVSRTHYAELKSRLGLRAIQRTHLRSRKAS